MTRLDYPTVDAIVAALERAAIRRGQRFVTVSRVGRATWSAVAGRPYEEVRDTAVVIHNVLLTRWCGGLPGDS